MNGSDARASRHMFTCAKSLSFLLALVVAAMASEPAFAQLSLPACTGASQTVSLDLSTTSSTGGADPNWTVSGPYGSSPPHQVADVTGSTWAGLSNWVQPSVTGTPPYPGLDPDYIGPYPHVTGGVYTYQIQFYLPCDPNSYDNLILQGKYYADNSVATFWLNSPSNSGPQCSYGCYWSQTQFAFGSSALVQGLNTLTIVVGNLGGQSGSPSGLAVNATLSGTCLGAACPAPHGHLRIIKTVVNPFSVTTPSTFNVNYDCGSGTTTTPVPVGSTGWSAPILASTMCKVSEPPPAVITVPDCPGGSAVWDTTYSPATAPTAGVPIQPGATTTVTITNTLRCDKGYLRICKTFTDNTGGTPLPANYTSPGFPISLNCPSAFSGWLPVPLAPGACSTNNPSLPGYSNSPPTQAGTQCTVQEASPLPPIYSPNSQCAGASGGWAGWATSFLPYNATATVQANNTATITVQNRLQCMPTDALGQLTIVKLVSNATWPSGTTFTLQLDCTYNGTTIYSGPSPAIAANGQWTLLLPKGAQCTVSEPTLPPTFVNMAGKVCTWSPLSPQPPVNIATANQQVTVSNSYTCSDANTHTLPATPDVPACPKPATYDAKRGRCVCPRDMKMQDGACVRKPEDHSILDDVHIGVGVGTGSESSGGRGSRDKPTGRDAPGH